MLKIGRQDGGTVGAIRLTQMASPPSRDDLQFALTKAQRNWRNTVELPWRLPETVSLFVLTVKCDNLSGEPSWMLYKDDGLGSSLLWSYVSSDVHLICNLVRTESRSIVSDGLMGGQAVQSDDIDAQFQSQSAQMPGQACAKSNESGETDSFHVFQTPKEQIIEAQAVDRLAIDEVFKSLSRAETGLLSYAALLFFLEREYCRFKRGGQPFAFVVFELCLLDDRQPDILKPLPIQSVREIAGRIKAAKRELDLLAHWQEVEFALLLPHTDLDNATIFVRRLEHLICGDPLSNTIHTQTIRAYFGMASVPEDCDDVASLIAAAGQRKGNAKRHAR